MYCNETKEKALLVEYMNSRQIISPVLKTNCDFCYEELFIIEDKAKTFILADSELTDLMTSTFHISPKKKQTPVGYVKVNPCLNV